MTTVTVPCLMPVGIVLVNKFSVISGKADVVISKSFGFNPSKESRTHPPTIKAS